MSIQGSSVIDLEYFQNLTEAVNNVQTCEELQALAATALESVSDAQAAIALELAKVQPMLALLIAPDANLTKIVTYLQSLITNMITPMVKPYVSYGLQLTATAAQLALLTAAIQSAASRIGNCSVSVP